MPSENLDSLSHSGNHHLRVLQIITSETVCEKLKIVSTMRGGMGKFGSLAENLPLMSASPSSLK